ncbi:unnamed protein product [Ciceribacter sp. T2.26MG-112.2]|nr:unnamed protein product [Ciceribacter naphthalenivorans]
MGGLFAFRVYFEGQGGSMGAAKNLLAATSIFLDADFRQA